MPLTAREQALIQLGAAFHYDPDLGTRIAESLTEPDPDFADVVDRADGPTGNGPADLAAIEKQLEEERGAIGPAPDTVDIRIRPYLPRSEGRCSVLHALAEMGVSRMEIVKACGDRRLLVYTGEGVDMNVLCALVLNDFEYPTLRLVMDKVALTLEANRRHREAARKLDEQPDPQRGLNERRLHELPLAGSPEWLMAQEQPPRMFDMGLAAELVWPEPRRDDLARVHLYLLPTHDVLILLRPQMAMGHWSLLGLIPATTMLSFEANGMAFPDVRSIRSIIQKHETATQRALQVDP